MRKRIALLLLLAGLMALPLLSGTRKGMSLPSDCDAADDAGRTFVLLTAEAGRQIHICDGAQWVQQGSAAGSLSGAWPVGSVYTSVVSTNPATLLGFGTWQSIAAGRVLVGVDTGQTEFDTVEETGGAKTHTLTLNEIPAHAHAQNLPTSQTGGQSSGTRDTSTTGSGADALSTGSAGGGAAHNNLQPYYTVYLWKRIS